MRIFPLNVHSRFVVLFAGSLALFAAVWWAFQAEDRRRLRAAEQAWRTETARQLERWLTIADRPMAEFLADYAGAATTRRFLERPDPNWARAHLESALADRHVEGLWLLRDGGGVAYHAQHTPHLPPPDLGLVKEAIRARQADRRAVSDFVRVGDTLWQLRSAAVTDERGDLHGWLVLGRVWNERLLAWLGELSGTDARVLPPSTPLRSESGTNGLTWRRELAGLDGRPLAVLELTQPLPALDADDGTGPWTRALFAAFALALVAAFALAVRTWVLRPLEMIGRSLAAGEPQAVEPLLASDDEFTHVARLVNHSFAQRATLESEVAERRRAEHALRTSEEHLRHALELRERLARDLHDHVIQSLYAAGLGLESVRAQMSVDPFGAEGRIRHCMNNLNETIRQVRSYISDLEPDAPAQRQRFTDAVRALTTTMRELWPVAFELDVEDALSSRLTPVIEIHALQIVRESLSNAIRHGRASRVTIRFHADGADAAILEVRDNGSGFDPVQRMGTGRGLVNLTTRAREMGATLRLDSAEGRGAGVILRLPLGERKT